MDVFNGKTRATWASVCCRLSRNSENSFIRALQRQSNIICVTTNTQATCLLPYFFLNGGRKSPPSKVKTSARCPGLENIWTCSCQEWWSMWVYKFVKLFKMAFTLFSHWFLKNWFSFHFQLHFMPGGCRYFSKGGPFKGEVTWRLKFISALERRKCSKLRTSITVVLCNVQTAWQIFI